MGRTKTWSVKPLLIMETLLIITGLAMSILLTGCDDATTPKPITDNSSTNSSMENSNNEMDPDEDMPEGPYGGPIDGDEDETNGPWRLTYFTGIAHKDMLRHTDDSLYSLVFLERWKVKQIYAQDEYLLEGDKIDDIGKYIHVRTDNATKSSNPMLGDIVTIYGMFVGTGQVTWQDGSSDIVPSVEVHKLYVNNEAPRDLEDFTAGYIDFLNLVERPSGGGHQYLSGTKMKVLCSVEDWDEWDIGWKVRPYGSVSARPYFSVDGYETIFDTYANYEEMKNMISDASTEDDMFWLVGNIVSVKTMDGYGYHIEFEVESAEAAGKYIGDYIPAEDPDDIDT